jgi:hypothetical protein
VGGVTPWMSGPHQQQLHAVGASHGGASAGGTTVFVSLPPAPRSHSHTHLTQSHSSPVSSTAGHSFLSGITPRLPWQSSAKSSLKSSSSIRAAAGPASMSSADQKSNAGSQTSSHIAANSQAVVHVVIPGPGFVLHESVPAAPPPAIAVPSSNGSPSPVAHTGMPALPTAGSSQPDRGLSKHAPDSATAAQGSSGTRAQPEPTAAAAGVTMTSHEGAQQVPYPRHKQQQQVGLQRTSAGSQGSGKTHESAGPGRPEGPQTQQPQPQQPSPPSSSGSLPSLVQHPIGQLSRITPLTSLNASHPILGVMRSSQQQLSLSGSQQQTLSISLDGSARASMPAGTAPGPQHSSSQEQSTVLSTLPASRAGGEQPHNSNEHLDQQREADVLAAGSPGLLASTVNPLFGSHRLTAEQSLASSHSAYATPVDTTPRNTNDS